MTVSDALVELLGPRELVAFVGAGGKTTLMLDLAVQLVARGHSVAVTTTTRMSADEVRSLLPPLWSSAPPAVDAALSEPGPVLLLKAEDESKVTGPPPDDLDRIFASTEVEYLLVEADGAQRRPFKAPASHEPVIPQTATLVVIVVGADALGQPIGEVAHRPERVMALSGRGYGDLVTPDVVAAVAGHDAGGLRGVPTHARVVVLVANVGADDTRFAVERIAALLAGHPRIERVVAA